MRKETHSLDVDWLGITSSGRGNSRTVGWLFFIFCSHSRANTMGEDCVIIFSWVVYFRLPNWLMIFVLFHGVGKGTCKILALVKRGGGRFCVDPEATLFVWGTTDLQNRTAKSTASRRIVEKYRLKQLIWVFPFWVTRSHLWPDVICFFGFLKSSSCVNVEIIGGIHREHERRNIKIRKSFMWAVKMPFLFGL